MEKHGWLAKNFEGARTHLKKVAYQMLGSVGEAEDAVQEAWIRLARSESEKIENLTGWLTTVVARVCLDILRSRKSRREEPLNKRSAELEGPANLERDFLIADAVGPALLAILDTLSPPERIAFVLHDLFDLPFDEIAPIIDRTEVATRQLASRARRRVQGAELSAKDEERQQEMVAAFLTASRDSNFDVLIKLLHPDVVLRADETAIKVADANKSKGAPQFTREMKGAKSIADTFKGKAAGAQLARVNGVVGGTWAPGGRAVVAFCFTLKNGKISEIDIVMDKKSLDEMDIEVIDKNGRGVS